MSVPSKKIKTEVQLANEICIFNFTMRFKRYYFLLLLAFLIFNTQAQPVTIPTISEEHLKRHVSFLASDSLQGRGPGTSVRGLNLAAKYIKKMGAKSSLQILSQTFPLISSRPDEKNTFLKLSGKKGKETVYKKNFAALKPHIETIGFSGELVFTGFGWKDSISGYNDMEGMDLQGKVAIYSVGTPESFREGFSYLWNSSQEHQKAEKILDSGAAGIILVTSPQASKDNTIQQLEQWTKESNYTLEPLNKESFLPMVAATPAFANTLFGKNNKWERQLKSISKKDTPESFLTKNKKVQVKLSRKVEETEVQNIIGIMEGSHPQLKEECVVFMAHYDHVGMNELGDVFNGADDNASGVATLLELAAAFAQLDKKPKRSIVFLWVTAEEIGLLGSEYYSKNPVFPLKKTVACINLDMVGRVYEPRDSVWNQSPKQVKKFNEIYTLVNDFNPRLKEWTDSACSRLGLIPDYSLPGKFLHISDHYHFHRNQVPVLSLSTGYTADYHQPTDDVSRIRFDKMKRVAELCFLVGVELANF